MKLLALASVALVASSCTRNVSTTPSVASASAPKETPMPAQATLHSLAVTNLEGKEVQLASFRGKVLVVVNTASECGYTPQYAGLQKLYTELAPSGVEVLGFPCNDFGAQEPGSASDIRTFCAKNYGVTFPLFSKVVTKSGATQSPVYALLGSATGKLPRWNFGKYVVGKDGVPLAFFDSGVTPDDKELRATIEKALAAK